MDALGSIGDFFGSSGGKGLESLLGLGLTGAGLYGNLSAEHQQQQEENYLKAQQAQLQNPTVLSNEVAAATQPLSRGLTEALTNQVQGTLAESGLAESPGITATALTQAEAPYILQNQQNALQLVLQRLGLPIQYGEAILGNRPQQTNLSPLLALLMRGFPGSSTTLPGATGSMSPGAFMQLLQSASMPGQTTTPTQLPDWLTDPSALGDFGLPTETYA
jgi:hypothetical protein